MQPIITFLQTTFTEQNQTKGIVAVSGGIDSAVSLTLLTKALGSENVIAVFLPFADQSTDDAQAVAEFNRIPQQNIITINIESIVQAAATELQLDAQDKLRFGNLKARVRMLILYDIAKLHTALVCGTENKSEKYLGYFTRFGDEASDIEPIQHLYKTQVRQLAMDLGIPRQIMQKAPSADLWSDQTDEQELGFSYHQADQVLAVFVDECQLDEVLFSQKLIAGIDQNIVQAVVKKVKSNWFKQQVPYHFSQ